MHQYLRSNDQEISVFRYCPLKLYSGDYNTVKSAYEKLSQSPTPHHKVFMDGRIVTKPDTFLEEEIISAMVSSILVHTTLMSTLKKHQMNLDRFDIEGLISFISKSIDKNVSEDGFWSHSFWDQFNRLPGIDEWIMILNNYISRRSSKILTFPDLKQKLYEYLISMTLKDLSILITFTKTSCGFQPVSLVNTITLSDSKMDHYISSVSHGLFKIGEMIIYYKLRVVDLDPKSPKFKYWFELDQRISRYFPFSCY